MSIVIRMTIRQPVREIETKDGCLYQLVKELAVAGQEARVERLSRHLGVGRWDAPVVEFRQTPEHGPAVDVTFSSKEQLPMSPEMQKQREQRVQEIVERLTEIATAKRQKELANL